MRRLFLFAVMSMVLFFAVSALAGTVGPTNTTSFKLSAVGGNSFFQSSDVTMTTYAGTSGTDLINASTLNGDMEDDSGWDDRLFEGGETNERSSTQVWEGSYSRHAVVDDSSEGFSSANFAVADAVTHRIDFMYYLVNGELLAGSLGTTALSFAEIYTTTSSWLHGALKVTSTATDSTVKIRFVSTGGGAEFYVDDVRISLISAPSRAHTVTLVDDSNETLIGYIGYADVAETLAPAKGVTGITKANPGVVTFNAGHGYGDGDLIYFSGLTEMTELNGTYRILHDNSGNTFQINDTSSYGAAETTGGNVAQRTAHAGIDGVRVYTTVGLTTEGWIDSGSNFDFSDLEYDIIIEGGGLGVRTFLLYPIFEWPLR